MYLSASCVVLAALSLFGSTAAYADKFHITAVEKAACAGDAVRLCFDSYPDEDKLFACMKANRSQLSTTCQTTFDAGVRRRRL